MGTKQQIRKRKSNKSVFYLAGFFLLVAVLSSEFSGWGMTGIFFALLFSIIFLIGGMWLLNVIGRKTNEMLEGRPNHVEFLLAPGGYRRRRYAETWDEYASKSVVVPTPNRPLHIDPKTVVEAVPSRAVAKVPAQNLMKPSQFVNARVELSEDFNPPHHKVLGRGILCIGQRGSGKSNVLALLLEQIWKLPVIPGVLFDYKIDFATLDFLPNCVIGGDPNWTDADRYKKYWDITVENAEMIGYKILEVGAQVVVQLMSYPDIDTQADVMSGIIDGMFAWGKEHHGQSVPAIVGLDEAQQFLPQNMQDSGMSKESGNRVLRSFKQVNEIGRSFGLQPLLFTQRAARINKDAIGGTEIYILMRQTSPQDLKACEEILSGQVVDRNQVVSFKAGDALVYEGGECSFIHFDERQSKHLNKTPTLHDAVARYGKAQVPERLTLTLPDEIYDEEEEEVIQEFAQPTRKLEKTDLERVVELLQETPLMSYRDMGAKLGMGKDKVSNLVKEAKERGLVVV